MRNVPIVIRISRRTISLARPAPCPPKVARFFLFQQTAGKNAHHALRTIAFAAARRTGRRFSFSSCGTSLCQPFAPFGIIAVVLYSFCLSGSASASKEKCGEEPFAVFNAAKSSSAIPQSNQIWRRRWLATEHHLRAAHASVRALIREKLKYLVPLIVIFMTCYVGLTAFAGGASSE
jgi:hypothetical protein